MKYSGFNGTIVKFFYTSALYYTNLDMYHIIYIENLLMRCTHIIAAFSEN